MSVTDDAALLGRARKGDEVAFTQLFARYQRQVFQYAAYMARREAADDIVQDTFLTVLRQRARDDVPSGSVGGYLIGIARHLVMKQHQRDPDWAVDDEVIELAPSSEPSAFEQLATAQSVETIRAAVNSLPPVFREAIVLCELQDIDYALAAELMKCPVGTVRSRLHRGRALLAAKFSQAASVEVRGTR